MDYTAYAAHSCGYEGVVLVVREEIRAEIEAHVEEKWPDGLCVSFVIQGSVPGTAEAVLSAADEVSGPFGVCNADDLYGEPALEALRRHFESGPSGYSSPDSARDHHLLVAYHLVSTVLTDSPVIRGLCEVDGGHDLRSIVEHQVSLREDGRFDAAPLVASASRPPRVLDGDEWVSMNLWGFYPRMLDQLANAVERFDAAREGRRELLLPDVVGEVLEASDDAVHVIATDERCLGITHADDMPIVREELSLAPRPSPLEQHRSN